MFCEIPLGRFRATSLSTKIKLNIVVSNFDNPFLFSILNLKSVLVSDIYY